jgi:putative Ca2+/H+ antiporter (TMEM165/GDT1 family)
MNEFLITASTAFGLIALAELGDKTQLVCMILATRHPYGPVLLGAVLAFAVLNGLGVLFGATLAAWLPEWVTAAVVAILFAAFGVKTLYQVGAETVEVEEPSNRGVLFSTFVLIFVAELGDKTQLAVAGTLGLAAISALGVLAGRTVLQRLPLPLLHAVSGALFLLLAVLGGWRAVAAFTA